MISRLLALCAVLLLPASVVAGGEHAWKAKKVIIPECLFSGSCTGSIDGLQGYDECGFWAEYDHTTTGTITFVMTVGHNGTSGPDVDSTPTTCTESAGTCNLNLAGTFVTPSLAADTVFGPFRLTVTGVRELEVTATHSASVGDIILTAICYVK